MRSTISSLEALREVKLLGSRKLCGQGSRFGKYRDILEDGAEFAGRRIKVLKDRIAVDQEKYILEELHVMKVKPGRYSNVLSPLTQDEFVELRSLIYRLN